MAEMCSAERVEGGAWSRDQACPRRHLSLSLSLSLFLFETNPELSSKNVDGHLPKRSKARVIEWLWNKFDTCQLNGFFKLAQPRPLSFLMGHPGPLLSLF